MTNPQHSETVKRLTMVDMPTNGCVVGKTHIGAMLINENGIYVLYSDHAAMVNGRDALVEAAKNHIRATQSHFDHVHGDECKRGCPSGRAVDEAREALKKAGAL